MSPFMKSMLSLAAVTAGAVVESNDRQRTADRARSIENEANARWDERLDTVIKTSEAFATTPIPSHSSDSERTRRRQAETFITDARDAHQRRSDVMMVYVETQANDALSKAKIQLTRSTY